MNLGAPTTLFFGISLVLVVLALIGFFWVVPYLTAYAFWLAIASWVVLAVGCMMKGA